MVSTRLAASAIGAFSIVAASTIAAQPAAAAAQTCASTYLCMYPNYVGATTNPLRGYKSPDSYPHFYNTDTYNGTNVRLDAGYVTDNNVSSVSNKTAYVVLVFAYDNNHFLCVQPLNDDNLPGALNDNTTSWREGPQTNCNQIGPSVKSPSGRIATRIK